MRYLLVITMIILIFISTISCEKEPITIQNDYFKALVLGKGIDCGDVYLIKFTERIDEVESKTNSSWNIYYADYLPNKFKQDSIIVYLKFRNPTPEELYFCSTLGPTYPHIRIIGVKD